MSPSKLKGFLYCLGLCCSPKLQIVIRKSSIIFLWRGYCFEKSMKKFTGILLFFTLPLLSFCQQKKEITFIRKNNSATTWSTSLPVYCRVIVAGMQFDGLLTTFSDTSITLLRFNPGGKFTKEEKEKLKKE